MLRDVVRRRSRSRRRRWAHGSVIHASSHFYHEKRVAWVSMSMHACDPVPILMGLRLGADSYMQRLIKCSSSRAQIKDSGLTLGVDDETSPFLPVKVSFRVHSKQ